MDAIMKYIAYKIAKNDPNLPDGFITEHIETDEESLEGYTVVTLDFFNAIFQNNAVLIRQDEASKETIVTVPPNALAPVLRPASDAQNVPTDLVQSDTPADNQALFNQFLAWVAAGKPGGPSNT